MDALVGWQVKLVPGCNVKGGVPWVEIAHDSVDAIFVGAMRITQQLLPLGALTHLALPRRGEGNEEALIAGIAPDDGRLAVAGDVAPIRGKGRLQPPEISEIFTQRQLAFDADAGNRFKLVELSR